MPNQKFPFKLKKQFRLPNWDYSSSGYYFITICTHNRTPYFGEIKNGIMLATLIGQKTIDYWRQIPKHFPNTQLSEFCLMPDHFHGIIIINNNKNNRTNTSCSVPTGFVDQKCPSYPNQSSEIKHDVFLQINQKSLQLIPKIIKLFKSQTTKYAKFKNIPFAWQSRYHDRIIRHQKELDHKIQYIKNNPKKWKK